MVASVTSRDVRVRNQFLIFERIRRHLALNLTEGTFEDVQEWARLHGGRCGLICNRKRTAGTVKPVLFLVPTFSDECGDWNTFSSFSGATPGKMITHRSMRIGSLGVAFSLNTRALASPASWQRMTTAPSVCLRGRAVKLLSMTSCARMVAMSARMRLSRHAANRA